MSRQPDFSTSPRPSRTAALETVAVAIGLLAVGVAGVSAWRARDEARLARERLDGVRREVEATSARLSALELAARSGRPGLAAADAEPARIVRDVASVLPGRRAARAPVDRLRSRRRDRDFGGGARRRGVGPPPGTHRPGAAVPRGRAGAGGAGGRGPQPRPGTMGRRDAVTRPWPPSSCCSSPWASTSAWRRPRGDNGTRRARRSRSCARSGSAFAPVPSCCSRGRPPRERPAATRRRCVRCACPSCRRSPACP